MNNQFFALLGREPELSLAELATTSSQATFIVSDGVVCITGIDQTPNWDNLGGIVRAGEVIISDAPSMEALAQALAEATPASDTKQLIGISAPGAHPSAYSKLCKAIKLAGREAGHKLRIVRSQRGTVLNVGEVIHNHLDSKGAEIIVWRNGSDWSAGRINWQQDVESYRIRDRERPARDARVGMLPPKLAQMLVNLSGADRDTLIYDPFCGTGVVLLEASRLGYSVGGSDVAPAMVAATERNLAWQAERLSVDSLPITEQEAQKLKLPDRVTTIVCEGWLGSPDLGAEPHERLQFESKKLSSFYRQVLTHWHKLENLESILIALPAWWLDGRLITLPLLDELESVGYTKQQFAPHGKTHLLYRRPDQTVGRMIVRLQKI